MSSTWRARRPCTRLTFPSSTTPQRSGFARLRPRCLARDRCGAPSNASSTTAHWGLRLGGRSWDWWRTAGASSSRRSSPTEPAPALPTTCGRAVGRRRSSTSRHWCQLPLIASSGTWTNYCGNGPEWRREEDGMTMVRPAAVSTAGRSGRDRLRREPPAPRASAPGRGAGRRQPGVRAPVRPAAPPSAWVGGAVPLTPRVDGPTSGRPTGRVMCRRKTNSGGDVLGGGRRRKGDGPAGGAPAGRARGAVGPTGEPGTGTCPGLVAHWARSGPPDHGGCT